MVEGLKQKVILFPVFITCNYVLSVIAFGPLSLTQSERCLITLISVDDPHDESSTNREDNTA